MKNNGKYIKRFWIAEGCFIALLVFILIKFYTDYAFFTQLFWILTKALAVGTVINLLLCYTFARQNK